VRTQEVQQLLEHGNQFGWDARFELAARTGFRERDCQGGLQFEASEQPQELLAERGVGIGAFRPSGT